MQALLQKDQADSSTHMLIITEILAETKSLREIFVSNIEVQNAFL